MKDYICQTCDKKSLSKSAHKHHGRKHKVISPNPPILFFLLFPSYLLLITSYFLLTDPV